jgi:hypothetical protein
MEGTDLFVLWAVNFRRNRSTTDQIFYIRQIQKKWKYNGTVHQPLVGFKKAYDSVQRELYNYPAWILHI